MDFAHVSNQLRVAFAQVRGNRGEERLILRLFRIVSNPKRFPNFAPVVFPSGIDITQLDGDPDVGDPVDVPIDHFSSLSGGDHRVLEEVSAVFVVQQSGKFCVLLFRRHGQTADRCRNHGK